jgi:hypothetical protein
MRKLTFASLSRIFCGLFLTSTAFAGPITLMFGPSANKYTNPVANARPVTITIGTFTFPLVLIGAMSPGSSKAGQIAAQLQFSAMQAGFPYPNMTVTYTSPNNSLTIGGLPNGTMVKVNPDSTGERSDKQTAALGPGETAVATIGFENDAFAATDGDGNDSLFTAGFITDAGEFDATVDANSLPNLEGSTIVAALLGDLEPELAGTGAQIVDYTPGDNDLNFLFDSTSVAGIVFGTTAQTDGSFGEIEDVGPVPEPGTVWLLMVPAAVMAARWRRRDGEADDSTPRGGLRGVFGRGLGGWLANRRLR